jgi:Xaa-Pro dipeptidase
MESFVRIGSLWLDVVNIHERSSVIPNARDYRRARVLRAREKLNAIRSKHADAPLILGSVGNVAWATGGVSQPIDRTAAFDAVWLVDAKEPTLLVSSVEMPRFAAEGDLEELGFKVVGVPWYEADGFVRAALREANCDGSLVLSDTGVGFDVTTELIEHRMVLSGGERELLRSLGESSARVVESAVRSWQPGISADFSIAAEIAFGLETIGAEAVCLIVGGDDRVKTFRHPMMTGAVVNELLMAVAVVRWSGLHVALTRMASTINDERLIDDYNSVDLVARTTLAVSVPGATWEDAYGALSQAYRDVGHGQGWRDHFQGGPIGYAQREFELSPDATDSPFWSREIEEDIAVAWNPSLHGGAKVEDTFLVGESGSECVTTTGEWPRCDPDDPLSAAGLLLIDS